MKIIQLTKGQETRVNDEDYEWLVQFNWYALWTVNDGQYYAVTNIDGKLHYMHRMIMNTPDYLVADHKDGIKLNNQRYNLRNITQKKNCNNRHPKLNTEQKRLIKLMKKDGWTNKEIEEYVKEFNLENKQKELDMSTIEDVLDQVIKETVKEGFIPCIDKANQESLRVQTFNRKNKLPTALKQGITISKFTSKDGQLWVKVYKKLTSPFMIMNQAGEMVPFKPPFDPGSDPALQRQLKLMREAGVEKSEIDAVVAAAKEEWERGEVK